MPSDGSIARQWRLLQILSVRRQGATVRELAAETDVVDKVDRISDVDVTDLVFNQTENSDASQYLAASFGILHSTGPATAVRVRFDATVAGYVTEKKWHAS